MTLKASFRLPADNWDDFNCLSHEFISGQLNKHPSRMWKAQQDNFYCFELTDKRIFTVIVWLLRVASRATV